jgi:hypothetical protein
MSEAKAKTSAARRQFSEEFKQDAVRLVTLEAYTFKAAAKAVGANVAGRRHLPSALPNPSFGRAAQWAVPASLNMPSAECPEWKDPVRKPTFH